MSDQPKIYELSGGAKAVVYPKPARFDSYIAIVTMEEKDYPEAGKVARNRGRSEFSMVLEGTFIFTVNGVESVLGAGDSILISDGDSYTISGTGKVVVLVKDSEGGTTEILPA